MIGIGKEKISKHAAAVVHAEEVAEVLEQVKLTFGGCPGTGCNAQTHLEILEGDLNAVHGEIAEHDKICQCWQKQNPKLPLLTDGARDTNRQRLARLLLCTELL